MSREPDYDEIREAYEERASRRTRCLCGYPDWPGQCPGPAHCPVHGETLDENDD